MRLERKEVARVEVWVWVLVSWEFSRFYLRRREREIERLVDLARMVAVRSRSVVEYLLFWLSSWLNFISATW